MDAVASVSGVVLAGGRSSRFRPDKLVEPLDDRPLVHRPIAVLAGVCAEVLIVVPPGSEGPPLPAGLPVPIRVIHDPEPYAGPLVGLLAALEVAAEPLVLVAGGDMPDLRADLLRHLLRELADGDASAIALRWRGFLQPLPSVMRLGAALPVARHLVGLGERSLRSLLREIRAREVPDADWRPLDPNAASLWDVDRPGDLGRGAQ